MSSATHSGDRGNVFNIILLGNSGTGKSASGNTLLSAGKHQRRPAQHFHSFPSSTPVTTKFEDITVKMFGRWVRVVDTPDFFYEDQPVVEEEIEVFKQYCKSRQHVILLVIQLGRFTDGEAGILEKLENKFDRISDHTIILFTHGENLHCDVKEFIGERIHLRHIVEACGYRYHVFKNNSRDSRQVKELIKTFKHMFPGFRTKKSFPLLCCG